LLSITVERYRAQDSDCEGVEQLVREYLSIEHRDDPEHGCPSAALLDEIGRCGDATEHAYTEGSWDWSTRSPLVSLPVILSRRADRRSACSRC
jgi:hypothetical protein